MPLLPDAATKIRANLEQLVKGEKPPTVLIGHLTEAQLGTINKYRTRHKFPPVSGQIIFIGRHIYDSRIVKDGYTIDDVLDQISSAMDAAATVINSQHFTGMRNPVKRADRYGNQVNDEVVFECWRHNPKSQLYTVVPKGDKSPNKIKEAAIEAAPKEVSGSPG